MENIAVYYFFYSLLFLPFGRAYFFTYVSTHILYILSICSDELALNIILPHLLLLMISLSEQQRTIWLAKGETDNNVIDVSDAGEIKSFAYNFSHDFLFLAD